jgi:hypothetical protein
VYTGWQDVEVSIGAIDNLRRIPILCQSAAYLDQGTGIHLVCIVAELEIRLHLGRLRFQLAERRQNGSNAVWLPRG